MAKDKSSQERIDKLIERINFLESILREQSARIQSIEQNLGIAGQESPAQKQLDHALAPLQTSRDNKPAVISDQAASPAPAPRSDLEARVGGSWFNRIGMLAIAIGVAFFLKYAFEENLIGPQGLIMIGILIGITFLTAGERMRARYEAYAHGLSGGGILILYISIYAAKEYQFLGQTVAFATMAAVTVIAAFLAARYNALAIAILGLIGGFLTPLLLGADQANEVGLFGYITLLDAGVLALAYSRQWRILNYLSFAATAFTFIAWIDFAPYSYDNLWTAMFFLTAYFAIFALVPILYNVVNRRPTVWLDLTLVFLNAVFYFGVSYYLLEERYRAYLGLFALMIAMFYLALGFFTYNRDRDDRLLIYTFMGLAILFLVLTVPIQLRQHWITMGWAVEGAVLVWAGMKAGDRTSRFAAMGVFAVAALYWAFIDAPEMGHTHGLLMSHRTFSCAVLIIALMVAARLYEQNRDRVGLQERHVFASSYVVGANLLAVGLLSLEAVDYFERGRAGERFDSQQSAQLENKQQLALSALWIMYGTAAMIAGAIWRSLVLRWMALALLGATIVKVFLVDMASLRDVYRIISFVILGAILLVVSFLYQRSRQRAERDQAPTPAATD